MMYHNRRICILYSCILFFLCVKFIHANAIPRIAIVGGGIGGTSTAYFLREKFGSHGADISLYENEKLGGRLATVNINGNEYEQGGAVIHERNKYMSDFIKLFEIPKRVSVPSKAGLYDGSKFVFSESDYSLLNYVKLFWKYGIGPIKLYRYVASMLDKFSRIYEYQDNGRAFPTVPELLKAMAPEFVNYMNIPSKEGFSKEGFSDAVIDDLIRATLTCNYGQDIDVHQFVGSVSIAGFDGDLWSIEGGNKRIPELLLNSSEAKLIHRRVTDITYQPTTEDFGVSSFNPEANKSITDTYNIVILAAPLTVDLSVLKFSNFPSYFNFIGNYHKTVCTIVHGKANLSYFEPNSNVNEILTVSNDLKISSFGRIFPVNSSNYDSADEVWKIFSHETLTNSTLDELFVERDEVLVRQWLAYPSYGHTFRNDSFVLFKNLYHVNAIEWSASAMEMSVVGAKNVALLAAKNWVVGLKDSGVRGSKEEL